MEPLRRELRELRCVLTTGAKHRQAAVAGDRVEPRLERDLALPAALKIVERGRKGVLNRVLGLLARAEHVAAEGQDAAAVALESDLEGQLVPAADLLHQPFVAGKGEQPLRAEPPPRHTRGEGITHGNAIDARRFSHYFLIFPLDLRLAHMERTTVPLGAVRGTRFRAGASAKRASRSGGRLAVQRCTVLGQASGPFWDSWPLLGTSPICGSSIRSSSSYGNASARFPSRPSIASAEQSEFSTDS